MARDPAGAKERLDPVGAFLEEKAEELRDFLMRLGEEGEQGAVGFVIDRDYLEIGFPLKE